MATKNKDQRAKPGKGQRHPWKAEHEIWLEKVIRGQNEAAEERRARSRASDKRVDPQTSKS